MLHRRRRISAYLSAALVLALGQTAARTAMADEIEDSIERAIEAYRTGDIAEAKGEIDFAAQLLSQKQAESLGMVLPAPFDGWTQEMTGSEAAAAMGMFGGGLSAGADYARGGENVEVQVMADNPMMTAMMAMFSNPAMIANAGGQMKRLGGQKVIQTTEGEIQAMVHNRFMITIRGSAPMADKEAYFSAIDFDALQSF